MSLLVSSAVGLPHFVRTVTVELLKLCEAAAPYLSEVFLGVLAFLALLKDWTEYGKLSKKWGRSVPLVAAIVTVFVTVLGLYATHNARIVQASSETTITQLSSQVGQLRADNQKNADGFRDSFSNLYDRFSKLQSKVQNAELLKEIKETKQQLIDTQNKLSPPVITPIASFPTGDATRIPITETKITRNSDVVTFRFIVYNASNYNAKTGGVTLRICKACTYANEPFGFVKIVGSEESDREYDFQHIWAHSATEELTVHVVVPPEYQSFTVGVFVACENCSPVEQQHLKVTLQ